MSLEGRIINVPAIQAWVPLPHNAPYGASKGAGISLICSMAIDLAPHGVIVSAIAPGPGYVAADGLLGTNRRHGRSMVFVTVPGMRYAACAEDGA